jgi:hypothetical protein
MNEEINLNIFINVIENGRYEATLYPINGRYLNYILPMNSSDLCGFIERIRKKLLEIVDGKDNERKFYDMIEIPPEICKRDLRELANLRIFDRVFLGDGPSNYLKNNINELKRFLEEGGPKNIQIIAKNFWIPWALMYNKELDEDIDPKGFWGFKHLLDVPIALSEPSYVEWRLGDTLSSSNLHLGYNMNQGIDKKFGVNWVKNQKDYFQSIERNNNGRFKLQPRYNLRDLLTEFNKKKLYDTISYYFCHGNCTRNCEPNHTTDDTWIELDDDTDLTLTLIQDKAFDTDFVNEPLVFINACETMDMSPMFYEGFVPFFYKKKSRGIIGTIAKIPGIFAYEFSCEFFKRLFGGQQIGSIMFDLRNTFVNKPNYNLLGLFYTPYCYSKIGLDSAFQINESES